MIKLGHLEMGKAVSSNPHITVKNGFLGLTQTIMYTPTQSRVKVICENYEPEEGRWIDQVLTAAPHELENKVNSLCKLQSVQVGNVHVERCISEDHRFMAVQLFRYESFARIPITEVKFYEGKAARLVASLF